MHEPIIVRKTITEVEKSLPEYDPLYDEKSKVELLDYMGDDLMVANSARVSLNVWHEDFHPKDTMT